MFTEERAAELYDDVKQCLGCGGYHAANDPPMCHGCATGRAQSGASHGYHPDA